MLALLPISLFPDLEPLHEVCRPASVLQLGAAVTFDLVQTAEAIRTSTPVFIKLHFI